MTTTILLIVLILIGIIIIFLTIRKKDHLSNEEILSKLAKMDADIARIDPLIRDEFGRN